MAGSEASTWRIAVIVIGIAILVAYVVLSGRWVTTGDSWYVDLEKPWWQPPSFVFGLIWPYNFLALGVGAVTVGLRAPVGIALAFLGFFAASVACAITWAWLFYVPHQLLGAAVALSLAALLTLGVLVTAYLTQPWLGWVLLPYQLWVLIAASLSWGYVSLATPL